MAIFLFVLLKQPKESLFLGSKGCIKNFFPFLSGHYSHLNRKPSAINFGIGILKILKI